MAKPTDPNIEFPQAFAIDGQKTDFLEEKIQNGFDPIDPDVLAGDNLNKFIDDTYKGLHYSIDAVNDLYKGAVLYSPTETYNSKSIVFNIGEDGIALYRSLTDNNLGNPLTDIEKWQAVDLGGSSSSGSGLSMFDLVVKDHILSFEESKGLAPQGSYVYKDAVPGSRYGYPDFYNRCVEEFEDDGNTLLSIKNNVSLVGAPVVDNGVISGFSTSNYATALTFPTDEDFVFEFKIKTGADISGEQEIFAFPTASGPAQNYFCLVNLESNNLNAIFNGGFGVWQYSFGTPAQPETDYIVKVVYSKTNNTLHVTMSLANGTVLLDDTKQVGELYDIKDAVIGTGKDTAALIFNPFKGSVDLKECYIESNGERIWSGATTAAKNPNGHIFYDVKDKEVVDEWFDTYGIADFYGVDKENERIFLPRNSKFFQFTTDTTKVNDMVEAGLPNIKGTFGGVRDVAAAPTGAFYRTGWSASPGAGSDTYAIGFEASRSNGIYGKSDTVQPPSSLKLLYYVVGNTDVQSAATDIVDVTTSENDTLPLFYNFYAKDGDMEDAVSFVKSTGTFLSGTLYPTAYEKLVARVGTGNVKAHTDDYTDYDFVVNQDEMTFRLPLKNGKETMFSTVCKGNGMTLGLTDGSNNAGMMVSSTTNGFLQLASDAYGQPFGTAKVQAITGHNNYGITPDPTKSGIVPHIEIPEGYSLYYKLLNAVVNQELVDFAHIQTELNTKLSRSNKEEIVSWGMPDYTAQTTFTLPNIGQTFTVPYDCLLWVRLYNQGQGNFTLQFNNASGAVVIDSAVTDTTMVMGVSAYLKQGWTIYRGGNTAYHQCLITPLIDTIGAN